MSVDDAPKPQYTIGTPPVAATSAEPVSRATFSEIAPEFLKHYQLYTEDDRTMPSQMRVLARYFGETEVAGLSLSDVERFFERRLFEGISRATLNRQRSALSVFLDWARMTGYRAADNPAKGLKKFREGDPPVRFLTPDEADRLLAAAPEHARPAWITALHSGGRRAEVFRLRRTHVNLETRILTFIRESTKGKRRQRNIPINDPLFECLSAFASFPPLAPLFTYRGRQMHDTRTALESARAAAGLGPDVNFHSFRRTFGSWFMMNGGTIYALKELLGHVSVRTTERYAFLSPGYIEGMVRFIGPPKR